MVGITHNDRILSDVEQPRLLCQFVFRAFATGDVVRDFRPDLSLDPPRLSTGLVHDRV